MTHQQQRKEINKSLAKPLSLTSGFLGFIQGIAWTIFAFLCILSYYDILELDSNEIPTKNETTYYKVIFCIFFSFNNNILQELPNDRIVSQREFVIFAWFYLFFSILWTLVSAAIIWAMIRNKWNLTKGLFGSWSTITVLISIVDIVLMSLLVVDYIKVDNLKLSNAAIRVSYGIVMSLAARGYLLWLINVIFAAIMTKYTLHIVLRDNNASTLPVIHGYESNNINPPWFDDTVKSFWSSAGPDSSQSHDNPAFERSFFGDDHDYVPPAGQSFKESSNIYSMPPTRKEEHFVPRENEPTSFAQAIANRTATIGKSKGSRFGLNQVAPPVIPDPDYTPPSSPKGKPLLRSKSNYSDTLY